MEDDCLEKVMWNVLQKFGLDEKKLAVFDVSESGVIAVQICDHLGVICEGLHVDIVAGWVQTISASEPYQKRLRGDLQQDPLEIGSFLHQSFMSSNSSSRSSHAKGTRLVEELWVPLSARQRVRRDQAMAKQEHETTLKDRWSKELYKELVKVNAPVLQGIQFCIGQERLHVAIAGKTRSSTLKRYLKAWRDWQVWKFNTWGADALNHPGMFLRVFILSL